MFFVCVCVGGECVCERESVCVCVCVKAAFCLNIGVYQISGFFPPSPSLDKVEIGNLWALLLYHIWPAQPGELNTF